MLGILATEMASSPMMTSAQNGGVEGPIEGDDVVCTPVLCQRETAWRVRVPAVQFLHRGGIAIFPLSKVELGQVWHQAAQIEAWHIQPLAGG